MGTGANLKNTITAGAAVPLASADSGAPTVLLDVSAACAHLGGLSPCTLNQWRSQRRGPAFVKVGRLVRYRLADLDAWLQAQRVSIGGC